MKNQKKLQDRRELVLDALERLLKEQGEGDISIEKLSSAAGIAKGSVYYYFNSKKDIVDSLSARVYAQIAGDIRSVMADGSLNALGRFRRLIYVYAQDLARNSHIVRFTYSDENIFHRKELDERNIRLSTPHYARIIRQGIEEGVFACEYPEELGELIVILVEHCLNFLRRGEFTANFLSRLIATERLLEDTLHAQPGSFSFFHEIVLEFSGEGREEIS